MKTYQSLEELCENTFKEKVVREKLSRLPASGEVTGWVWVSALLGWDFGCHRSTPLGLSWLWERPRGQTAQLDSVRPGQRRTAGAYLGMVHKWTLFFSGTSASSGPTAGAGDGPEARSSWGQEWPPPARSRSGHVARTMWSWLCRHDSQWPLLA